MNFSDDDEFVRVSILIKADRKRLGIIARAFKEYKAAGKTMEDFEEDYDCVLVFDETHTGIKGISFQNDSCKTAFMLKYDT